MFQRNDYLRFFCVLWLSTTAVAAQSNQPIEIDPSPSAIKATTLNKKLVADVSPIPTKVPAQGRLVKIAQKLAAAEPKLPSTPGQVVAPLVKDSTERAEVVHSGHLATAAIAVASVSSNERLSLGKPTNVIDASTSDPKPNPLNESSWFIKTVGALGVVLAAILLTRMILNRVLGRTAVSGPSPLLEVLARVSVARGQNILLIRTGRRVLLVGDGSSGLRTLADIQEPEEVAGLLSAAAADRPHSVSSSFSQLLSRFNGDYRDSQRRVEEGSDVAEYQVDRARDQVSSLASKIRNLNPAKKGRWA